MKVERLNIRHLRGFKQVATTGNVTRAAVQLNMSQPALTQALAKLEALFGEKLFIRSRNGFFLTPAGSILTERTRKALEYLGAGTKNLAYSPVRTSADNMSFEKMITMTQLRSLLAVSKARSFSHAARQTGLSQPSIHRAAKEIEQIAGTQFFVKTKIGIELTAPAQRLADNISLMFTELQYGFEEIQNLSNIETGRISIGTLPLARSHMLPKAINRFLLDHPTINFQVQDGLYSDLLRKLRTGELDILVGALRNASPADDVEQHHLFEDPLAIVTRTGHPLLHQTNLTWVDLSKFRWVLPRAGTPTRQYFDRMMSQVTELDEIHIIETSSLVMIRGLLTDSDYLTISSLHQIETERQLGLLTSLEFDLQGVGRNIGLTTRRDWAPSRLRTKFFDVLKDEGQKLAPSETA